MARMVVVGPKRKRVKPKKHEKEPDEIERLEKEVRELKAINRSLLKQLKKLSKGIHKQEYEEALENIEHGQKEDVPKRKSKDCEECGKGKLSDIRIAGRLFRRCELCGWKSGRVKE